MKLSTKGRYGVKTLYELALHQGAGPLSLKVIADRQGLSEHYLEQLAAPLRKGGLIQSVRGAQGGYILSRPASQITVGDIIRALEGPLEDAAVEGERETGGFNPWESVRARMITLIDSITLDALVEQGRREMAEHLSYQI